MEVPRSAVLDARGMRRATYQSELKRHGKSLALVADPCNKGHDVRLRLSSGHCVECSPIGLSKVKTRHKPGFLYVAFSRSLGLLKVGSAISSIERADGLNRDGYAGATDWGVVYRRKFTEVGVIEDRVHTALSPWKVVLEYTRRGHGTVVKASEVFSCTYIPKRGMPLNPARNLRSIGSSNSKARCKPSRSI
jgi:hypothetical protein